METAIKKPSKKAQTRAWNIDSLMTRPNAKKLTFCGWVIISYQTESGNHCLAAFDTRNAKPYCNYVFRNYADYTEYLGRIKTIAKREQDRMEQLQKEAEEKASKYKVGTLLYSSWGYEQTNIDFYIVMEVKGSFLKLHQIGKTITRETGFMSWECIPDETELIGEPFRKKINKWGDISLESYKSASIWDGKPMGFSSYA
jgi:hypothetical protein